METESLLIKSFWENQRVFVTGGMGFIGSNLIKKLNELGCTKIRIYDKPDANNVKNIKDLYYESIELDENFVLDKENVDIVFHLAANSSTRTQNFDEIEEINVNFTKRLIKKCSERDIPIFYASSAAIYGNIFVDRMNDDVERLSYDAGPENLYALSKHIVDLWAKMYFSERKDIAVALRYFNVWGPRDLHKGSMKSYINKLILLDKSKKTIEQPFSICKGRIIERDFIFVEDAVNLTLLIAQYSIKNETNKFDVYNIGTGNSIGFFDFFKRISKKPLNINVELPKNFEAGYQIQTKANIRKIKSIANVDDFSFVSIEDGIEKCKNWIRENT